MKEILIDLKALFLLRLLLSLQRHIYEICDLNASHDTGRGFQINLHRSDGRLQCFIMLCQQIELVYCLEPHTLETNLRTLLN